MTSSTQGRGILTLAYGDGRFVQQAKSLAYSLQLHAPQLARTLVTDSSDPELGELYTHIVPYRPEYGGGVQQKLFLDEYSPFEETLFIDSDCLVLGNLGSFWEVFSGRYFSVPGFRYLHHGDTDPYLDVDFVLDWLHLTELPKFNGGTYYFTRSPEAKAFFEQARRILKDMRTLRLGEFRKCGPNDEAVYSIAMALNGLKATPMGSGGMWTPTGYSGPLVLDAIAGRCTFEKEGRQLTPEVIHFAGEYAYAYVYPRECARLAAAVAGKKTSALSLLKAFALSVLWQTSRQASALSKVGRTIVRTYRKRSAKA